tara:strand:+ start:7302 stop:7484 length:183 start_codon:yes stop_codon:yes gene_type:complete
MSVNPPTVIESCASPRGMTAKLARTASVNATESQRWRRRIQRKGPLATPYAPAGLDATVA